MFLGRRRKEKLSSIKLINVGPFLLSILHRLFKLIGDSSGGKRRRCIHTSRRHRCKTFSCVANSILVGLINLLSPTFGCIIFRSSATVRNFLCRFVRFVLGLMGEESVLLDYLTVQRRAGRVLGFGLFSGECEQTCMRTLLNSCTVNC